MSRTFVENRVVARMEINGAGPLSSELIAQVDTALNQAEDLGPAAVLLVHVAGLADPAVLQPWPGQIDIQSLTRWERVLRRVERTCVATIALVEHACSALALELLLVADRRLATSDFSMQCATSSDVWPGMALYRLSRQIGESQARKLFLDYSRVSAEKGLELNVIDEIVAGGASTAQLLAYAPPEDFPVRRRLMQDSLFTSFDDALGVHLAACDRALRRSSSMECATTRNGAPAH